MAKYCLHQLKDLVNFNFI